MDFDAIDLVCRDLKQSNFAGSTRMRNSKDMGGELALICGGGRCEKCKSGSPGSRVMDVVLVLVPCKALAGVLDDLSASGATPRTR